VNFALGVCFVAVLAQAWHWLRRACHGGGGGSGGGLL
jgi:hypothetical protein